MSMTVLVTRNAPPRCRGFLASCMLEIAPGVYTSPRMTGAVRDRVWTVLEGWHSGTDEEAYVMTWQQRDQPGDQVVRTVGLPKTQLIDYDGVHLSRRTLSAEQIRSLTIKGHDVPL